MPVINEPDRLGAIIDDLLRRIQILENSQKSALAVLPADPAHPRDGDTWLRTSDQTAHIRVNGVTKTFTVT